MRIGLIDVDSHGWPNLALMKISAFHKAQGDHVEWYYPLISGHKDRVYMSKVFSFSPDYEYFIEADEVIKGGSGYCIELENGKEVYHKERDKVLPEEIEHQYPDYGLYGITETAYGYLTRGCPRNCLYCHTTQKDGRRSVKVADLSEFWQGQKQIMLLDQNILACRDCDDLLDQLIASKATVEFNGGLDIMMVNERNIEKIRQIKAKTIHFAFDRYQDRKIIMRNLTMFKDITGCDRHKGQITVYILVNFDTTLRQDLERIQFCRRLDYAPYVMIYDKANCAPIYRKMQRWVNNRFVFQQVERFSLYENLTADERRFVRRYEDD